MKKLLFLFLTIPCLMFSQCPDGKANEYKQKAAQYGDASYSTLAVYYYYKCQCENGIANRTAAQVNSMVDQYNGLKANKAGSNSISLPNQHQVQWVNISKVSKCSNSKSSNDKKTNKTKGTEETIKKTEPFFTKEFLEENIINLINGDSDKVLSNFNNEIQIKNTMKNTGFDRQTSENINSLGIAIGKALNDSFERSYQEKRDMITTAFRKYEHSDLDSYKHDSSFKYIVNFNDQNWSFFKQDFADTKVISDNQIEIIFKKRLWSKEVNKDNNLKFLAFTNDKLNVYADFDVSFKIGHLVKDLKDSKFNKGLGLNFLISDLSQVSLLVGKNITNFNIYLPNVKGEVPIAKTIPSGSSAFRKPKNEYEYIYKYLNKQPFFSNRIPSLVLSEKVGKLYNPNDIDKTSFKFIKKSIDFRSDIFKSYKKLKENEFVFIEYKISNRSGELFIEEYLPFENTIIKFYSNPVKIKYLNQNSFSFNGCWQQLFNETDKRLIIKDFTIVQ